MNKGDLIARVAAETRQTKRDVTAVVTAVLDVIMEEVASGGKVTLVGFGVFEPRNRAERTGRNPQTGDPVKIPAAKVPAFSAGKGFKEVVAS